MPSLTKAHIQVNYTHAGKLKASRDTWSHCANHQTKMMLEVEVASRDSPHEIAKVWLLVTSYG